MKLAKDDRHHNYFIKYKSVIYTFAILSYIVLLLINSHFAYLTIGDEAAYMQSVDSLFTNRIIGANHPFLAQTFWFLIIKFFYILTGTDNVIFWRVGTMIFSTGCLIVFYNLVRLFFKDLISFACTVFLALDPMFFTFGRILMLDIPSLFFYLTFLFFYIKFLKDYNLNFFLISAVFLGLSLATKMFALPLTIILIILLFFKFKVYFETFQKYILSIIKFEVIVFLSYIFGNFIYLLKNNSTNILSYTYQILVNQSKFNKLILTYADSTSPAWSWFTIPQVIFLFREFEKGSVETIIAFQNPIFFITSIFAFVFTLILILKREKESGFIQWNILIIIVSLYFPWFTNIRPTYYYYIIPLIPLVIILSVSIILKWKKYSLIILSVASILNIIIFGLYYPLLVGIPVPYSYEKLLTGYSVFKYHNRNSVTCQLCSPIRYPKLK